MSEALKVTDSSDNSATVWGSTAAKLGAAFTSVTVSVKEFVKLATPSLTLTRTFVTIGPCDSVGVQSSRPSLESVIPVGPLTNSKLKVLVGKSGSVAVKIVE